MTLQQKRLFLLVYVLIEGRDAPVRRDQLLALFWPEADLERARNALRQALFALRSALGTEIITANAAGELLVDRALVRCDALELLDAVAVGDHVAVNARYTGEFCPALHSADSADLGHWLDQTRDRLRRLATASVRTLLAAEVPGSRLSEQYIERLRMLAPYDETAAMQHFALLVARGDRAAAVESYRDFARRLRTDLEIEPSEAFTAMVQGTRIATGVPLPAATPIVPATTAGIHTGGDLGEGAAEGGGASLAVSRPAWRNRLAMVSAVAVLLPLGVRVGSQPDVRLVDVQALTPASDDSALVRVAAHGTEALRGTIASVAGFRVSERATSSLLGLRRAGTLVKGGVERERDGWRAWATVTGAESDVLLHRAEVRGASSDSVLTALADRIGAVVATRRTMELRWGETLNRPSALRAFELYVGAFTAVEAGDADTGIARFAEAWRVDSMFLFAGILAAGNALAVNQFARADSLLARLAAHEVRMLPLELHQFRRAQALARSDVRNTLQESRVVSTIEPNAVFLLAQYAEDAYLANRPREALAALDRIDRAMDNNSTDVVDQGVRAAVYHQLGRFADELAVIDGVLAERPTQVHFSSFRLAPLAALNRVDSLRVMLAALSSGPVTRDMARLYRSVALELRAHGHAAGGDQILRDAAAWAVQHPVDSATSVARTVSMVELLIEMKRERDAGRLLEQVVRTASRPLSIGQRSAVLGLRGVLAARAGRRAESLAASDSLALLAARGSNGIETYRRARIFAALGEDRIAIALVEQAIQEGFITVREFHVDPEFARLRALPAFLRVTAPRG